MANLQSLASTAVTSATSLSNLILVSPQAVVGYQPQTPPNPNGTANTATPPPAFLFHYEGTQTSSLESEITDHFTEDNTAIQDHIALRPVKITTQGFIGELNDIAPYGTQTIQQILSKFTIASSYVPAISATALIAYQNAFQLYQTGKNAVNAAVSSWSSITNSANSQVVLTGNATADSTVIAYAKNQNKQQVAYQQFYGYWSDKTLFTIQTPWAVFENVAIESIRATQEDETNVITRFDITFKLMRFAASQTTSSQTSLDPTAALQGADPTNLGSINPPSGPLFGSSVTSSYPGSLTGGS